MTDRDDVDVDEIAAEADAELDRLTVDAEPVPLEEQMRETNEALRQAFQEWERQLTDGA